MCLKMCYNSALSSACALSACHRPSPTLYNTRTILLQFLVWDKSPAELAEILPKNVLSVDYGGDGLPVDELKSMHSEGELAVLQI